MPYSIFCFLMPLSLFTFNGTW